jgi:hypothetical protein
MKKEKDKNIVTALSNLPKPMINCEGILVYVREEARSETGAEHIAAKKHFLKVRDVEAVPGILKRPLLYKKDPKRKRSMNYYGKRPGQNNKVPFLKIVTNIRKDAAEEIITIFPQKRVK